MRNQKRIDIEKFSRMWWRLIDGKLTAEKDISRDPFGDFEIAFKMSAQNGAVEMEIRNRAYPILNRNAKIYESFEGAVSALSEYFEEIDGYAKKVAQSVKERAKKASQYIIGQEIEKIAGEML